MTLGVYTSRSFIDWNLFQMGCFVVARFLLTSQSRGPCAIAELLVITTYITVCVHCKSFVALMMAIKWMNEWMSFIMCVCVVHSDANEAICYMRRNSKLRTRGQQSLPPVPRPCHFWFSIWYVGLSIGENYKWLDHFAIDACSAASSRLKSKSNALQCKHCSAGISCNSDC